MELVTDDGGHTYVVIERSEESRLLVDPHTGRRATIRSDVVGLTDDELRSADAVHEEVRSALGCEPDERAIGLLVVIGACEGVPIRALLEWIPYCESERFAVGHELVAAGLLERTDVGGERGYTLTEQAARVLDDVLHS